MQKNGSQLKAVEYGLIKTPRVTIGERLKLIHDEVETLIHRHAPDTIATERLFFAKNQTTAMDVAKALGVIMLAAAEYGIECHEYSPPEVKLAVVGNGSAEKRQVEFMIVKLLALAGPPKPDDVADALAIAVTHALRSNLLTKKL